MRNHDRNSDQARSNLSEARNDPEEGIPPNRNCQMVARSGRLMRFFFYQRLHFFKLSSTESVIAGKSVDVSCSQILDPRALLAGRIDRHVVNFAISRTFIPEDYGLLKDRELARPAQAMKRGFSERC